jgi:hypothetical protein
MTEHVPAEAYPNVPVPAEVPLSYLEAPDEDGYYHQVYTMDADKLRDHYIVRPMRFEDGGTDHPLAPEQAYDVLRHELERAHEHGIAIPRVTAALPDGWNGNWLDGQADDAPRPPMQDVLLATERVTPVEITEANVDLARKQAERTVAGITAYLKSSYAPDRKDGKYFLTEPFYYRNYMYGIVPSDTEPDFYMVDTECSVDTPEDNLGNEIDKYGDIILTARVLGELTQDPDLREHAKQLLEYNDTSGMALDRMEYTASLNAPDYTELS